MSDIQLPWVQTPVLEVGKIKRKRERSGRHPHLDTQIKAGELLTNRPEGVGLGDLKSMLLVWEHIGLGIPMEAKSKLGVDALR